MRCTTTFAALFALVVSVLGSMANAGMKPNGRFVREPYFGVVGQPCETPDPVFKMGAPGVARPSPPKKEDAQKVEAFLSAAKAGDKTAISKLASDKWLLSEVSNSCIAAASQIEAACGREPLYLLGDLEIRATWVCGDTISYYLFFTLKNGKITNVWSMGRGSKPLVVVQKNG